MNAADPQMQGVPELPILRISEDATLPTRTHSDDAGLDLYALEDLLLEPGQGRAAKTGISTTSTAVP